jgi:hypothetical protein
MRLNFAFLAQAAELVPDGRFFVLGGGIDRITIPSFPGVIPSLALVAELLFSGDEYAQPYPVRVTVTRPDGKVQDLGEILVLSPRAEPEWPERGRTAHLVCQINSFLIPLPGIYEFQFSIHDQHLGEFSVRIAQPR